MLSVLLLGLVRLFWVLPVTWCVVVLVSPVVVNVIGDIIVGW